MALEGCTAVTNSTVAVRTLVIRRGSIVYVAICAHVSIVGWIMIIPSCLGWRSIGAASSVVVGRPPQIAVLAQAVLGVGIEKRVPPGRP